LQQNPLAFLALMRPLNCLIAALSVYVGAFTFGLRWPSLDLGIAALSAALIAAAGNAFNDVRDVAIDRINRPARPLPAGKLSQHAALYFCYVLVLAGLALAWWLTPLTGLIASCIVGALTVYSISLKNTAFWGNLCIGLIAALAFPYGALALGGLGRSWIPAGFAFLFHLGREIVKDIEDIAGDRAGGAQTLPLLWTPRQAAHLAALIFLFLIAFTALPWIVDLYSLYYLIAVALVDLLLIYAIFQLYRIQAELPNSRLAEYLKAGMLLGLLAIITGELTR
jgi:geranylgeranylglycerol-phosphate geranylgeranyltransferase